MTIVRMFLIGVLAIAGVFAAMIGLPVLLLVAAIGIPAVVIAAVVGLPLLVVGLAAGVIGLAAGIIGGAIGLVGWMLKVLVFFVLPVALIGYVVHWFLRPRTV